MTASTALEDRWNSSEFPPPLAALSNAQQLDELEDELLDQLPYGVICLDERSVVLRYNLAEARLARLDRRQVLGKNFFERIAPCTATPEFQGRFQTFVARCQRGENPAPVRFSYLFDFKFGAQEVEIEIVQGTLIGRYYLCINRKRFLQARSAEERAREQRIVAPKQSELAPEESSLGLRRDDASERQVTVPASLLQAMDATWQRVAPQGRRYFGTYWGLQWGRLTVVDLEQRSLVSTGRSLRDLTVGEVLELYREWLRSQGWGRLEVELKTSRDGLLWLRLERSVLAESLPGTASQQEPRCNLLAGLFQALFGHLSQRILACAELRCVAQGHPHCTFALVSKNQRNNLQSAVERVGTEEEALHLAFRELRRAR